MPPSASHHRRRRRCRRRCRHCLEKKKPRLMSCCEGTSYSGGGNAAKKGPIGFLLDSAHMDMYMCVDVRAIRASLTWPKRPWPRQSHADITLADQHDKVREMSAPHTTPLIPALASQRAESPQGPSTHRIRTTRGGRYLLFAPSVQWTISQSNGPVVNGPCTRGAPSS